MIKREELCVRLAFCPELHLAIDVEKISGLSKLSSDSTLHRKVAERRGILLFSPKKNGPLCILMTFLLISTSLDFLRLSDIR